MKLFEFTQRFPDEASCESYLKAQREKSGIVCKKCGCRKNYWDSHNKCWRCSKCGHETTLTADTVMHKLRDVMGKRDSKYTLLGIDPIASTDIDGDATVVSDGTMLQIQSQVLWRQDV